MEPVWAVIRQIDQKTSCVERKLFELDLASRRGFREDHGETHYLWRAVDHEGEVLEVYVTKSRNKRAGTVRGTGPFRNIALSATLSDMKMSIFRYFKTSPEVIRLAVHDEDQHVEGSGPLVKLIY